MSYDGVIFDKDGVLLDSMNDGFKWARKIRVEEFKQRGANLNPDEAAVMVNAHEKQELQEFISRTGLKLEDIQKVEQKVVETKIQKIRNGEITVFSETEKVLQNIDLKKSLASNAPFKATEFTLEHFELKHFFEQVASPSLNDIGRYVERKKPSPAMINEVMDKTGMQNPLMVGDTSADILAAKNAGIDCCLVNAYKEYSEYSPEYRISNLEEILDIVG